MGCCSSSPAGGDGGGTTSGRNTPAKQSSLTPQLQDSALDPGLKETHEYMGRLGRGGTGEICQFRDKATGRQVRGGGTFGRTNKLQASCRLIAY